MTTNKQIDYRFFHWGPFLYKTSITEKEIELIQKLCSKDSEDARKNLAGLLKHEKEVDKEKLFPIIYPYIDSYLRAASEHYQKGLKGDKITLKNSWVNFMEKNEANPLHHHDGDISFVLFTEIPEKLKKEIEENVSNETLPGTINFIYTLNEAKLEISSYQFIPERGDFFIFPAKLKHYVNPFKSDGMRISISGNLEVE